MIMNPNKNDRWVSLKIETLRKCSALVIMNPCNNDCWVSRYIIAKAWPIGENHFPAVERLVPYPLWAEHGPQLPPRTRKSLF